VNLNVAVFTELQCHIQLQSVIKKLHTLNKNKKGVGKKLRETSASKKTFAHARFWKSAHENPLKVLFKLTDL